NEAVAASPWRRRPAPTPPSRKNVTRQKKALGDATPPRAGTGKTGPRPSPAAKALEAEVTSGVDLEARLGSGPIRSSPALQIKLRLATSIRLARGPRLIIVGARY